VKKESVILLLIVVFLAGFIAGAISGIKFYASNRGGNQTADAPAQGQPGASQAVNPAEILRLEEMVRTEPTNVQALITLGNLYFDSNQYQKAATTYERALAIQPNNPDVRTDLGVMYRALKNYDAAIKEFREAARIDPTHKNSRFNLGIVLTNDKKDVNGAIAAWEDYLRIESTGEQAAFAKKELDQLKNIAK
jgi:cytochrome c-type biogenesis protein CcmH/NrfG